MAAGRKADGLVRRSGRVVDRNGAPVPDALVSIVESTVPMPELALRADSGGAFGVGLPSGRFTLRAHSASGWGDAEVEGAPAEDEIVIVVEG